MIETKIVFQKRAITAVVDGVLGLLNALFIMVVSLNVG
jgi:hypothetical protein